jgi:hypothetical protein
LILITNTITEFHSLISILTHYWIFARERSQWSGCDVMLVGLLEQASILRLWQRRVQVNLTTQILQFIKLPSNNLCLGEFFRATTYSSLVGLIAELALSQ